MANGNSKVEEMNKSLPNGNSPVSVEADLVTSRSPLAEQLYQRCELSHTAMSSANQYRAGWLAGENGTSWAGTCQAARLSEVCIDDCLYYVLACVDTYMGLCR